jgi:hypothetical protein
MTTNSTLAEHLLNRVVRKSVSEKLGALGREVGEFLDGLSDEDKRAAKLMVLMMTRGACKDFCDKMGQRIENGK